MCSVCFVLLENALYQYGSELVRPIFFCEDRNKFHIILLLCEFYHHNFNNCIQKQENLHLCLQHCKPKIQFLFIKTYNLTII